ncbi:hypothetical protein Lal_00031531 [Lupinus albus]|nr:hypothetical protein Lal_00031531 [Lupinus albus]
MTSQESENWPIEFVRNFDVASNDHDIRELQKNAYNVYYLFAKRCGFSVRRGHTYKRNDSDNIEYIYIREFICHRAGIVNRQKVTELEKQRKRKSSRCNCSAKLFIKRWMVTYFSNSHNHALLDDKEVQFLPAYRDIPNNDQSRILLLSKVGCSISIIIRVLELEKGIEADHFPYLEKDIRNFLQSQSSVGNENDASDVLKLCKSLKDIDDVFQQDFTMDESNKLKHIIWVFGDSIRAYETFGDVVVFHTTYRINRYDMPLGLWVGLIIMAIQFSLDSFLHFVKGKYPRKILTDQDHALKEAISTELSNTKHAFCIWHIVSKLPNWFSFSLGPKYDDFKSEFCRLCNLEYASDFEKQ